MVGIERAHQGGGADALATVTKRATDGVGRRALANEAVVLGRLAHPGVVRLVAHTETGRHAQLITERVPGPTLAEIALDSPGALAAVGAACAAVMADLHALGIAHGSLTPDHLIVSDGRVVLCSFGRAGEATAAAMDRDVADLVVALGDVASRLAEPVSRVERRRRRRLDDLLVGAASRSLAASELGAALADLAGETADGGARGPLASPALAATAGNVQDDAVSSSSPSHGVADAAASGPPRPAPDNPARPWRERVPRPHGSVDDGAAPAPWHRRRNVVLGAAAGLAVVALWAVMGPDRNASTATPSQTPVAAVPATPTPAPRATPTPSPPPASSQETPRVVVIGNLVAVDDTWFEVGRSGDIVRVGDWDCDGSPSPAVLRPTSGEVFVFEEWAEDDGVRRVDALAVIPGAADLTLSPTAGCDTLVVIDDSGREAVVEVTS
jgi:hypothetical protein